MNIRLAQCALPTLALFLLPGTAFGAAEAAAQSLETLGIALTRDQRATITAQFSQSAPADQQEWYAQSLTVIDDMAELGQTAARPSARLRLQDLHRQLIERLLPDDNLARDLMNAQDPLVHTVEAGVGMTERDMGWSIMLEALKADMQDDPRDLKVSSDQADALLEMVNAKFESSEDGARQFMARVDAWGMGTMAAWPNLTPEERKIAVSVVTDPSIPPANVLNKVIGTSNVLFWAAGVDIGLTDTEKADYPELVAYLEAGHLAGGMANYIGAAMDGSLAQSTDLMGGYFLLWDYNMQLLLD